jgi:hypothetical protein
MQLELCAASKGTSGASTAVESAGTLAEVEKLSEELLAAKREITELKKQVKKLNTPGETVKAGEMAKQKSPYFCTPGVSDHTAWVKEWTRKREAKEHFGADAFQGKWSKLTIPPTYWCDKLQNNLSPWVRPLITADDVVVGIYTGESLFYSRGSTTRDTWLLNFKHHYIFSSRSEPRLPVIGLLDLPKYKHLVVNEESQNAQWAQLIGLKEMYERSPNQKWYYIVGCDNFVNTDNLLRRLDKFDASKPYVLAQFANPSESISNIVNISKYPGYDKFPEEMKKDRKFEVLLYEICRSFDTSLFDSGPRVVSAGS